MAPAHVLHSAKKYERFPRIYSANDKWLRSRSEKWELKLPFNKIAEKRVGDLYDEIEDENKIREIFGIPAEKEFEKDLKICHNL